MRAALAIAALVLGGCQIIFGFEEGSPAGDGDGDGDLDAGPPNTNAALASLLVSRGALDPSFEPDVTDYTLALPLGAQDLAVTPTAEVPDGVSIQISGMAVDSGTESPALALDLGDNVVEIIVTPDDGESRTYTIAANRGAGILQQAYAKTSNTDASDVFGFAVALDGDTLAVGAPEEDSAATGVNDNQTDNSASGAGAVYVFVRSNESWSQQAYLKASNTPASDAERDQFGSAVSLDGDTLAVGAPGEDSSATGVDGDQTNNLGSEAGAVYVFVRNATSWSQQAYLKASNANSGDFFGEAVSLDGNTLVVGATGEDSAASGVNGDEADNSVFSAGAAYVFVRSVTSWSQQAYLKASNPDSAHRFGRAVGVDGDTLAVGAAGEAGGAGAVYIFVRSGISWSQQAQLKASDSDTEDQFGLSVALDNDTVVVGAPREDSAATAVDGDETDNSVVNAGAAYVFVRSNTTWSQQAYLKASNTDALDNFGASVALDGDTLAVGAPSEDSDATGVNNGETDNSAANSGAVYVFVRSDTTWSQQAYVKASNTAAEDRFGQSVALDGDTLAVGARFEDSDATGVGGDQGSNAANDSGAVYVFQ